MANNAAKGESKPHTWGEFAWNTTVAIGALAALVIGAEVILD